MSGAQNGSKRESIPRGGLLDKIRLLLEEEGVIDSTPRLVAVPLPIAVSLEQAAALLAVAPSTLQEYTRSGQLRSFRLGRRVLIRLDALDKFSKSLEDEESERYC